ncbi:helix-turn-helix domain-containing protein, partial [Mesorhizobium sp. M0185]|uniref:helix-turn-helix domain-containing protein n=1 Tax=Mesorhizobium sp. M0185 TaxID=2956907 RepID=UPI0033381AA8
TFAWMLLEHLSAQLRRMTERVFEYSTLVVRKRLIVELLHRAEKAALVDGEVSISPAPTHSELAATMSTHREAVSREMSDRLIEKRGSRLLLHDVSALRALVDKKE